MTLRINEQMKIINTRLHGMLDYTSAFILILPWVCTYKESGIDTLALAAVGVVTALYSIFTDYELGLVKLLTMKMHLALDVINAIFLITLPLIFPINNYHFYWPVLFGATQLVIIILSSSVTYRISPRDLDITKP